MMERIYRDSNCLYDIDVAQKANPGKQGLTSLLCIVSYSLLQMGSFPGLKIN